MLILIFSLLWLAIIGLGAIAIILEYLEDEPEDGTPAPTPGRLDEANGLSAIFLF